MRKKQRSRFEVGEHSIEVLAFIRENMDKMRGKELYEGVKKIDPTLPTRQAFDIWIKKIRNKRANPVKVAEEKRQLLAVILDKDMSDIDLLQFGIEKAMTMGDILLSHEFEELKELVEAGKDIPPDKRKAIMEWYKIAGNLYIGKETLNLKRRDGAASEAVLAILARAARAGKITVKEVTVEAPIEAEIIENDGKNESPNTVPST